jgi:hypothetical protein
MKKLKSYIPAAILATIFLAGILECFKAEAFMGDKTLVTCVCCLNGMAVSVSNTCDGGDGTCVEGLCPPMTDKECRGNPCP